MRDTPTLTLGVADQTLELRFPSGRPTAATFDVLRALADDDSAPEFFGTAALDPVNTTASAAAGPARSDPQRIDLASTAGVSTSRKYLLTSSALREYVTPVEVGSTYIRVRHPLQNDYPIGATLEGTTVIATVPTPWISDISKLSDLSDTYPDYRVRWTVSYAGSTSVLYSFFDVVRGVVGCGVDIDDINGRAPGLHDSIPAEYRAEDGRPLVVAAWRAVRAHLQACGIDIAAVRDGEALDELVILRALRLLAEGGWTPKNIDVATYIETTTGNYDRFVEQHFLVSLKHRLDEQRGRLDSAERASSRRSFWVK